MADRASSSSFSQILRRSKFASYQPSIGQIYSSPYASLTRGDWGIKHTISSKSRSNTAARARIRFLTIPEVDSELGLPVWKIADKTARFVRQWGGEGIPARITSSENSTAWATSGGTIKDPWKEQGNRVGLSQNFTAQKNKGFSAFTSVGDNLGGHESENVLRAPDVELMSQDEFQQYLQQVKQLQPAYRLHLHDSLINNLERSRESSSTPLEAKKVDRKFFLHELALSKNINPVAQSTEFLNAHFSTQQSKSTSTDLPSFRHPTAGLQYSLPTQLSLATAKPVTGHYFAEPGARRDQNSVAVGGLITSTSSDANGAGGMTAVDLGLGGNGEWREGERDPKLGKHRLRVFKANLAEPPRVVHNPSKAPPALEYATVNNGPNFRFESHNPLYVEVKAASPQIKNGIISTRSSIAAAENEEIVLGSRSWVGVQQDRAGMQRSEARSLSNRPSASIGMSRSSSNRELFKNLQLERD